MSTTVIWTGTLTAVSSIVHGGDTRGTITLLHREVVVQPDGRPVFVPVISGNAFRGRLRRIGEELLRDTLRYEGELPLSVAHALRGGGALAKTPGTPLSGRRLAALRDLVPHVGVFGCAGGGRIVDGCLQVGKVMPFLAETAHILGDDHGQLPSFDSTQLETQQRCVRSAAPAGARRRPSDPADVGPRPVTLFVSP
jgi:CRISPR type IV-associated protein Csf2